MALAKDAINKATKDYEEYLEIDKNYWNAIADLDYSSFPTLDKHDSAYRTYLDSSEYAYAAVSNALDYVEVACYEKIEVVEKESQLSSAKKSTSYLTRTVLNRVQTLRPFGGTSFLPPDTSAGQTGLNAGDEVTDDYPANLSVDVSYGDSEKPERFKTRTTNLLLTTDFLIDPQRLVGYGVGYSGEIESILASQPASEQRAQGLTATAYLAQILNKNLTFVPHVALTFLSKKKTSDGTPDRNWKARRTMASLTLLGQMAPDNIELSGFGQLAYTNESPSGNYGSRTYIGQAIFGGEVALKPESGPQPFFGVLVDYDLTQSETTERKLGWKASTGFRSISKSGSVFSAMITTGRKGEERTTVGNMFIKFFF